MKNRTFILKILKPEKSKVKLLGAGESLIAVHHRKQDPMNEEDKSAKFSSYGKPSPRIIPLIH